MKFKEEIISFLYPRRCPVCDEIVERGKDICDACRKKIIFLEEPLCKKCGKIIDDERKEYCGDCRRKKHFFTQGKGLFSYEKEMKLCMYRFKYSNKREYGDFFAKEAVKRHGAWMKHMGIEVIVPIPMYVWKKRKRGYNQAEVFAKRLSAESGVPLESKMVCRIRDTVPQKELNDVQRKNNLKNAFKINRNIVKYRKILLVDDIYTTGSTMDAVAELLRQAGVKEVYCICICIGNGY